MECKVLLAFNTAITGLPEEDGKWDEQAHKVQVLPLRGKIMQIDGATGSYIARYAVEVKYLSELTTPEAILAHVQRGIDWLMSNPDTTLFPLRGEKVPSVTIEQPKPTAPSCLKTVIAYFTTDLTVYTKDEKLWGEIQSIVGAVLVNQNGVRGYEVHMGAVAITIDTHATSVTATKRHIRTVLDNLRDEGDMRIAFFPFLETGCPRLRFVVKDAG